MGEFADLVLEGYLCHMCGVFIDHEAPDHPRSCQDCIDEGLVESLPVRDDEP